jgi:hypothetical protein
LEGLEEKEEERRCLAVAVCQDWLLSRLSPVPADPAEAALTLFLLRRVLWGVDGVSMGPTPVVAAVLAAHAGVPDVAVHGVSCFRLMSFCPDHKVRAGLAKRDVVRGPPPARALGCMFPPALWPCMT